MLQELLMILGVDLTKFGIGLKKSESMFGNSMKRMRKNALKTLGAAFGAGALTRFTKDALTAADRIDNLRTQLNATAEEVQRLDISFNEAGLGGAERLAEGLESLNRNRQAAVEGNEMLRKSFETLGISMEEANDASVRSITLLQKLARNPTITTDPRLRNAATRLISQEAGKFLGAVQESQSGAVSRIPVLSDADIKQLDNAQLQLSRAILVTTKIFQKLIASLSNFNTTALSGTGLGTGFIRAFQGLFGGTPSKPPQPTGNIVDNVSAIDLKLEKAERARKKKEIEDLFSELDKGGLIGARQGGIATRAIGGMAFSGSRPDQVIAIQNKQLEAMKSIERINRDILQLWQSFRPY